MDIRKVKKLIEMLEESQLNEIEIKEGEESVKLVKAISIPLQEQVTTSNIVAPAPQPAAVKDNLSAESDSNQSTEAETISGQTIDSPMVGTFYAAPNPGAKDFVALVTKFQKAMFFVSLRL
jgi:acetyl-CoA carboxylase biotin carboxyl carrier protein